MLFNSFAFLAAFAVLVTLYYLIPHRFRWPYLLAASFGFYATFEPRYLLAILAATLVAYAVGLGLSPNRTQGLRKAVLAVGLLLELGALLLFKYYGLKASEAGYLSTIFEVAGVAGVIGLGVLSDRVFGGRRILPAAGFIALMVVGCVLLYAVGDTGLAMYAICTGIIGFALFGPDAILTSASAIDVGSASSAAKAAGIINGLGAIGSVAQEFLVGRLLDSGSMGPVFAALVITSLCAFGSLLFILRRNKTGRSNL